jgi:hypothetical protein
MSALIVIGSVAGVTVFLLFWASCIVGRRADQAMGELTYPVFTPQNARGKRRRSSRPYWEMMEDVPPTRTP